MKNLEIKVQFDTFGSLQSRLFFAKEKGILRQKDTYYLLGDTKLKLREEKGKLGELILYMRPEINGSRESRYTRFSVPNFLKTFVKSFFSFIFGEKIIIDKERFLFLYKHTRIHLDRVEKLGNFVELETLFNTTLARNTFIAEHNEVKKLLGLEASTAVSGSYSEMLLRKQRAEHR